MGTLASPHVVGVVTFEIQGRLCRKQPAACDTGGQVHVEKAGGSTALYRKMVMGTRLESHSVYW